MKKILLLITIVWSFALFSEIPDGYYDGTAGQTGETLKNTLHNIIDNHTAYSYSTVWNILQDSDEDPDNPNNVKLFYTGWSISKNNHGGGVSQWNREHVWAKSHGNFGTATGPGTDAHHLRPTDVTVNSARGSKDFDMGGNPYTDPDGATGCYTDSDSWEPNDEVKGDVARIIFYMATRYEGEEYSVDLELNDNVNNGSAPYHGRLSVLLQWHAQDPVSDRERYRNDVIYEDWQHNRNPFIDHPEYANFIWGGEAPGTTVSFEQSTYTVAEGIGSLDIDVSLSEAFDIEKTIEITTSYNSASSDDVTVPASVTFPANSTSATITIQITQDNNPENNETFTMSLVDGEDFMLGSPSSTVITIEDNSESTNLEEVNRISTNTIQLTYSGHLNETSALNINNYNVEGVNPATILYPLEGNYNKLLLGFDSLALNEELTLEISELVDAEDQIITAATSEVGHFHSGDAILEDFENGEGWNSYDSGEFVFETGTWEGNEIFLETNVYDNANIYDGEFAVRINDNTDNAYLQTPEFPVSTGFMFHYAALHDEDEESTFQIQVSENGGEFQTVQENTFDSATFSNLGITGSWQNVRFRIVNNNQEGHLIIDNASISTGVDDSVIPNCFVDYTTREIGESIKFADRSTVFFDSVEWDFENDGVIDSNELYPTHTYDVEGTYSVRLIVTSGDETFERVNTDYITITGTSTDNAVDNSQLFSLKQNPVRKIQDLRFTSTSRSQNLKASLYNLKGQKIETKDFANVSSRSNLKFDTDKNLANGIYFIRVHDGQKASSKKFTIIK